MLLAKFMAAQNILNRKPVKGKEVFIAPNATLIGDVTLGDEVSVVHAKSMRPAATA